MPLIDFRFRPHTSNILRGLTESPIFREALVASGIDLDDFLAGAEDVPTIAEQLRKDGITKAILVGRDAETTYGFKPNNDELLNFTKVDPDLFIAFAGLDPHKGMDSVMELTRRVNEDGFGGAAIDPIYNLLPIDHAKFYPIYAKCVELSLPIVITTGPARYTPSTTASYAHPDMLDRVAVDFPDLKIVVSHGAWPYVNEMIGAAFRNKNIFVEISEYEKFPQAEAYIDAAKTILQDQMIFASAHPFVHYKDAINLYSKLGFSKEVYDKIMYRNAARILGLNALSLDGEVRNNVSHEPDLKELEKLLDELARVLKNNDSC